MLRELLFSTLLPALGLASFDCRPPGPILPRPTSLSSHPTFAAATSDLERVLQQATSGDINAGWAVENTSFSIGLVSLGQENKGVPVWEYHHLASNTVDGTKEASRDSQYLIGSISKVISDYMLLMSGLSLDDPVTKHIPALRNNGSRVEWDVITLRHLASGLAGVPQYYGFFEIYTLKEYYESLGFPHLEDSDYEVCGVVGLNAPCTDQEFFEAMSHIAPVTKPADRPFYSTISFYIFVRAIEEATGKNYTQLLEELVVQRLGMTSTVESPGTDSKAVIPPVPNMWGASYEHYTPGAGLVSTLSDLSRFLHSILDRSILNTETAVREWLKPSSATGSPYALVGMPWEIYRARELTPRHPHTVDLYAKGGASEGYRAQVAVVDDYGVAIVVLTAGPSQAANFLYGSILSSLLPAIDDVAREQGMAYTGTYVRGEDGVAFNVTIAQDENSTLISGLERDGRDMLVAYREVFMMNIGGALDMAPTVARIYPLDISTSSTITENGSRERQVVLEEWRLDWELSANAETELPGRNISRDDCQYWVAGDWTYYGNESLDKILFLKDPLTGEVLGIEIPILRSGFLGKEM